MRRANDDGKEEEGKARIDSDEDGDSDEDEDEDERDIELRVVHSDGGGALKGWIGWIGWMVVYFDVCNLMYMEIII